MQQNIKRTFYERYVKRCLDVFFALLLLIVLSPLFLIITICSKMFIHGKVVFTQIRPGRNGKVFKIYKFRTMTEKKDAQGNLLPDGMRTPVFGKFLRRFSLDELPQLINILRGDMSFVGPRPVLVKDVVFWTEEQLQIYRVRPGLTGLAQVSGGRSQASWSYVLERHLTYQKKVTFWRDIMIVIKTFFVVLFRNDSAVTGATHSRREYYYADYLIKHNYITETQYHIGMQRAEEIVAQRGVVTASTDLTPKDKEMGHGN